MTTKHEHVRTNLSRRSFLVGTGIVAAGLSGAIAGCAPKASTGATESAPAETGATKPAANAEDKVWELEAVGEPEETLTADIAIIGGGGTGLAAAIQAVDLGLKPIIVERLAGYGGSFIGTEGMTALESH